MTAQTTEFDVIVIGGGSGGYSAALRSAQLGRTVLLIEKDKVGGTCLHAGCIPTKALLHAAEVADAISAAASLGLRATLDGIDAAGLQMYRHGVVARLYKGLEGLIASTPGITSLHATGALIDAHTVEADGVRYTGRSIVLATGSRSRTLPHTPIGDRVLTSTEALDLDEIPRRAVIIGGSVIGVEFASAWRSLGAEVTVVEALGSLVPGEDPVLAKQLQRAFKRRKITVLTGTRVSAVQTGTDAVTVTLEDQRVLEADRVLVAIGREPVTDGLNLEAAGIRSDDGWVHTDDRLRTSAPTVYAVGDLVRGPQLAHRGFAHGIFVAEDIAGLAPRPVRDEVIPRVTYCDPELVSVGLTEKDAQERYGQENVAGYQYSLAGNGKSLILDTSGVVKMVTGPDGTIVGVHMIGARLSEQAGEAALLVDRELRADDIAHLIHAHPTQNEALGETLMALAGKPLHTHA